MRPFGCSMKGVPASAGSVACTTVAFCILVDRCTAQTARPAWPSRRRLHEQRAPTTAVDSQEQTPTGQAWVSVCHLQ
eukprot:scaffold2238_cov396-Prasinococcus_capsulatus_cf.AAC.3